jgi:archaellum component FlaF (FlaF/FlaG flagellin family)
MGFATSITIAIFFVSFLIIASMTYPILINSYKTLQNSRVTNHDIHMDQLNTAVDIIRLTDLTENSITITVLNKGSTVLNVDSSDILIDGLYANYSAAPTGHWMPLEEVRFTINTSTSSDHRISFITENGNSDFIMFYS